MDYLSDSSAENDNGDLADLQRLHVAWKNVRQKRQSDKKSASSVKNAIQAEQQKNLETRLAMTQKQLGKARENTALLMKKLSEAQQELDLKDFELNKERKINEQRLSQIEELRILMERRVKEDTFAHSKQNIEGNNQMQSLKKKYQIKERQVDRLCLKIKSLELDYQSNSQGKKKLQEINQNLKRQLSQTENVINEVYINDHSKGAQLMELHQAHKAIQRLVLLLRGTDQYRQLGNFAEEVKEIHFLSNIPKRFKANNLNHRLPDRRKMCNCMEVKIDERLLWTPQGCYKAMLEMKMKYDSLTEDCIQEVLFELNKIWLARQQTHVKRVRENYEGEISKVKKRFEMKYDELVARKQIQRLKKQLTGVKNLKQQKKGVSMEHLKNIGQYEDEVRIKQRQIKLLQERVRLLEAQSGSSDRVLYLEGTLWIIEKVLTQMGSNEEDLRQFETQFRQKIEKNICPEDWVRSFKEFFESTTQINNALVEKLVSMRESTLKKISGDKGNI